MKKIFIIVLSVAFILSPVYSKLLHVVSFIPRTILAKAYHPSTSKIQIALLLDTSNSMDGLIDQAKSQLWKMVNELAVANKDGHPPKIELALYHYGNSNLSGEEYFIQRMTAFTGDLDLVSEKLFALRTNGGNEYCGAVIKNSIEELEWSNSAKDLKLIIIAGNEPFDQGPIDFKTFCKKAKASNIQINTIFCGDYMEGKSTGWWEGSTLAEGKYMNIDQEQKVIHITTPYDKKILELNIRLNDTYIGYGALGASKLRNQKRQDANAMTYGMSNARTRASVKAKESYSNADWDLVDAAEEAPAAIESLSEAELPEVMQGMTKSEQKKYIADMASKRKSIQAEILVLEKQAQEYEKKERSKLSDTQTLDNVLINAVKEQAEMKAFKFD